MAISYNPANCVISVSVSDYDRSLAWYREVLGFDLDYELKEYGWCELKTPFGFRIGLGQTETVVTPGNVTPTFGVARHRRGDRASAGARRERRGLARDPRHGAALDVLRPGRHAMDARADAGRLEGLTRGARALLVRAPAEAGRRACVTGGRARLSAGTAPRVPEADDGRGEARRGRAVLGAAGRAAPRPVHLRHEPRRGAHARGGRPVGTRGPARRRPDDVVDRARSGYLQSPRERPLACQRERRHRLVQSACRRVARLARAARVGDRRRARARVLVPARVPAGHVLGGRVDERGRRRALSQRRPCAPRARDRRRVAAGAYVRRASSPTGCRPSRSRATSERPATGSRARRSSRSRWSSSATCSRSTPPPASSCGSCRRSRRSGSASSPRRSSSAASACATSATPHRLSGRGAVVPARTQTRESRHRGRDLSPATSPPRPGCVGRPNGTSASPATAPNSHIRHRPVRDSFGWLPPDWSRCALSEDPSARDALGYVNVTGAAQALVGAVRSA